MKQIKLCIIIALLLFIPITLYYFIPTRITPKKELSKDDIKIKVHLQVTTGPLYYLKEDKNKLWNTIKNTYPDANPKYIQLTGNLPNYAAEGKIPLFNVKYSDASLAPIFRDDSLIGRFSILFLFLPLVTLLLLISLIVILFKEYKSKNS